MPRDHYIAQTYLKHFVGKNGFIQAYRKSDGKVFPCRPNDICHERDGDVIPDFLVQSDYLGEYRKLFEPYWSTAIAHIEEVRCPDDVKLTIAGYWGNLLVCTPAWKRVGISIYNRQTIEFLKAHRDLKNNAGQPDIIINDALSALDAGKITFETNQNYIRAVSASQVMQHALMLYNANWIVIRNDTDIEFLTSDNPAAMDDPGPFRGSHGGIVRYLPLTPKLCLVCEPMPATTRHEKFEITSPPKGRVRFATTTKKRTREINRAIVQCAENLVLSSENRAYVGKLTEKYAKYRVVCDFHQIPKPGGHLSISKTRVRAVEYQS